MKFSCFSVASLLVASGSAFAPSLTSSKATSTALQAHSGVARNPNFAKLVGGYLFPEIGRRRNAYLEENPEMADRIISLGIGDTTKVFLFPSPSNVLKQRSTSISHFRFCISANSRAHPGRFGRWSVETGN